MIHRISLGVTVWFPADAAGGPDLELTPDIRAEFWIEEISADCRILVDTDFVHADQKYEATLMLVFPGWFGDLLTAGRKFLIKRGSMTYGYGVIDQIGSIE